MRQVHFDLGRVQFARVAPDMEQDKLSHPIDAGVLGTDAVIQPADTDALFIPFGCCARGGIDRCFRVIYNV